MHPLALSPEHLRDYQQKGVVRLGKLLSADEVAEVHARLDRLSVEPNPVGLIVHNLWRQDEVVRDIVTSGVVARLAAGLLGEAQVALFQDNLVWKTPGATAIEWHQDYSYQPLSGFVGVTTWLSLDATDPETGCLHYIPGTQKLGERAPADFLRGTNQPRRDDLPPLDWSCRAEQIIAMPTAPGELIAHHPLVWHMSPPNRTTRQRRALSINWMHPATRWKPSQAPHPFNYALRPTDGEPFDPELFPVLP